jgi:poly(hydroxyalkanoate) granule-associated protein
MAKRTPASDEASATTPHLADTIKDSAQQIWLAGLGAFAKAQAEGGKAFESLVKEGLSMQRKTQSAAEERLAEATSRVTHLATDLTAKATGQWDKLENIFEERVAKALHRLDVPSAPDLAALTERVEALERQLLALRRPSRAARTPANATARPAAKGARRTAGEGAAATTVAPARRVPRKKAAGS